MDEKSGKRHCCYGTCRSDQRYAGPRSDGITFFPFPKPKTRLEDCKQWIKSCGRPHDQLHPGAITKNFFVCSKHFIKGRPTEEYPYPIPFDGRPAKKGRKRKNQDTPHSERKCSRRSDMALDASDLVDPGPSTQPRNTLETSMDILATAAEMRTQQDENSALRNRILQLEAENKQTVTNTQSSQTAEESLLDKVCNSKVKGLFESYTGLPKEAFKSLFQFLVKNGNVNPVKFPTKRRDLQDKPVCEQLLLVLMRLRGGFSIKDLAFRFNLSKQSVSEMFTSWIGYMFCQFGQLSWWPHRDVIINNMTPAFKKAFPHTIAIIDCTEVKTETPSSLKVQSQCYSDYKSSTTLKSLIAVDPKGAVIFVSPLFSGSISDNEICVQSGFYEFLTKMIELGRVAAGDAIMADKGFTINKELSELGLELNLPPFASSSTQMSAADVAFTKLIASHRIHVERRIGRIKNFKLVSQKIPITLFPKINEIWFVCCFLSNFQSNIVKRK